MAKSLKIERGAPLGGKIYWQMGWMANRKWKEIKQQPSMLPGPAVPGCCLVSFHFLWTIHPVVVYGEEYVRLLIDVYG